MRLYASIGSVFPVRGLVEVALFSTLLAEATDAQGVCMLPIVSNAASSKRSGDDRIFTVPNVFSLFRLLLVPVFVWLLFGKDNRLQAAVLLAVIGGTDWVDGWYARNAAMMAI